MELKKIGIVLVRPQLPENIGMVARVMENFGLKNLVLIDPREKWPNDISLKSSKKGKKIIFKTKIFKTLPEALERFNFVIATTNRKRFLETKTINSFKSLNTYINNNKKTAILFGPENSGLSNQDLRLANFIFSIDTSHQNTSLNLSHAVSIIAYKINEGLFSKKNTNINSNNDNASTKKEISFFMNYLVSKLEEANFFNPLTKKNSMIDNIYSIFSKASLTKKEVKMLWGIVKKLGK